MSRAPAHALLAVVALAALALVGAGRPRAPLVDPAFAPPAAANGSWDPASLAAVPCAVVRFHAAQRNALAALLLSLAAQAHPNLHAVVVDTGEPRYPGLRALLDAVNAATGRRWVSASPRSQAEVRKMFPAATAPGGPADPDFGYLATDLVLEDLLARPPGGSAELCTAFLATNGDNLYSPRFLPSVLPLLAGGHDLAGTHWITHHACPAPITATYEELMRPGAQGCGHLRMGAHGEVVAHERFLVGCTDLGAAMFSAHAVRSSGLRFGIDALRRDPSGAALGATMVAHVHGPRKCPGGPNFFFCADGHFLSRMAARPGARTAVVRGAMLYHQ